MLWVLGRQFGGGLHFATDNDNLAMGPNLLQKQWKFPIYVRKYKETGHVDEVVLWVLFKSNEGAHCNIAEGGVLDNNGGGGYWWCADVVC